MSEQPAYGFRRPATGYELLAIGYLRATTCRLPCILRSVSVAIATSRSRDHRRLILGLAILLLVAGLAFTFKIAPKMPDFEVYWRAASRALAGEPLYRPEDGHWLFKYLPVFAIVIAPIALLPIQAAKAIWFIATLASLALLLRVSLLLLPRLEKPAWLLVLATLVVMGKFYAHELTLGQSNLMLAAAVAGALLAMKRGREVLAGALVVIAVILKPYAVILLPWLLARRRRGAIVSAAVGMTAALLLPIARYALAGAIQLHVDWWHTAVTSIEPNLLNADNVSWVAMSSRWFDPGPLARGIAVGLALAAFALLVDVYRQRRPIAFPELLEGGLLLTLIPFLSPQGWDYTLLMATPAVVCLLNYERELPIGLRICAIAALAVVGLAIYDVLGRTLYAAFMNQSGITIAFLVIIAASAALRYRQVA